MARAMTVLPPLATLFADQRRRLIAEASRVTGDPDAAEDVVQEAWLKLAQRGPERPVGEPIGYIRRVVRNLAIDAYRQRRRQERIMPPDLDGESDRVAAAAADAEQAAIAAQQLAIVAAELRRMSPPMRRAVEMHRLSGVPLREIAAELGVSITTAHSLVIEGVARCRRALHPATN
ncbi:sigma-70 family RNA polymerase sigma factor [Sphingomonas sp. SORGH_AS_0742]|uniref:RNA polymerase sigma factor n=2 Tax=unclassified Sphingomonas TaxID=196159 RepID=UPI00285C9DE9|nr:sigma-70 family RNA polymerase sigma factor [Sphingomonas sp. SORGH_AS_0742]MDR6150239.1 RNA polymerase sigma factor (sigma-70 family) [Sphingomonas sp. SORGH_AS_0742]